MTLLIESKGIDPRLKVVRPCRSSPLFLNCLIDSIKVLFKVEMYKFEGQRVWERHTLFWRNLRSSSAFFLPIRGGTIPIPNNHNSGSLGYFGGIGARIGSKGIIKGIVFRFPIPHFTNRQKFEKLLRLLSADLLSLVPLSGSVCRKTDKMESSSFEMAAAVKGRF